MSEPKYRHEYKKESIKKRTISIYLPTIDKVDAWKAAAKAEGMTLSKFIQEHVDNSLRDEYTKGSGPRRELQQKIKQLEGELQSADRHIERFEGIENKLDRLLRQHRNTEFEEVTSKGSRRFDRELIDHFRKSGFIFYNEILAILKPKPGEVEMLKGIEGQLKLLEDIGLIIKEATGWRWRG